MNPTSEAEITKALDYRQECEAKVQDAETDVKNAEALLNRALKHQEDYKKEQDSATQFTA